MTTFEKFRNFQLENIERILGGSDGAEAEDFPPPPPPPSI